MRVYVASLGVDIIHDPLWNKGMAMDYPERDRLNLRGLVPPRVKSLEEQMERTLRMIRREDSDIRKNMILQDLHDRNEVLYHRIVLEHIKEIAPLIYTPTVGVVCQQFGLNFRRSRGMYFSRNDRGMFNSMVYNWPHSDVKVIVVTDGSRILGLGDLGVHGMGIPIGKLALYCAAGGIAPSEVLPIMLDVGTNNEELLASSDYVGTAERRLEDDEYFDFVDEFMQAVTARWPHCVVQFEDFETPKAAPLLAKYREMYRCFNDDIQGTGCVTLAGIISAARNAGSPDITGMKFLCVGAGSAGLGVCSAIVDGMVEAGMSPEAARNNFVICTSQGALGATDGKHGDPNASRGISADRRPWVNPAVSDGASMLEVIETFKPRCLLGLAAQGPLFTEEMLAAMCSYTDKPIVMPMSNPTAKAECTPEQAYRWTAGRAVVATGSPFASVTIDGTTYTPSQCNNMYVFPGIGLAAALSGTSKITDKMLYAAAVACADSMNDDERSEGRTFPALERIRDVSHAVACAVIEEGFQANLVTKLRQDEFRTKASLETFVRNNMWLPEYRPLVDPTPRHHNH